MLEKNLINRRGELTENQLSDEKYHNSRGSLSMARCVVDMKQRGFDE